MTQYKDKNKAYVFAAGSCLLNCSLLTPV